MPRSTWLVVPAPKVRVPSVRPVTFKTPGATRTMLVLTSGCDDPLNGNCGATSVSGATRSEDVSASDADPEESSAAVSTTRAVAPLRARVTVPLVTGFVE